MRLERIYVDTSVFGGPFDAGFEGPSWRFFEEVKLGYFIVVISPTVQKEVLDAPEEVRNHYEACCLLLNTLKYQMKP